MTIYSHHGEAEFVFASQKGRLLFYGLKLCALDSLRDEITATSAKIGKG